MRAGPHARGPHAASRQPRQPRRAAPAAPQRASAPPRHRTRSPERPCSIMRGQGEDEPAAGEVVEEDDDEEAAADEEEEDEEDASLR